MKKRQGDSPHVRLYFFMLESAAWKMLPASARCVFIEVLREWAGKDENSIMLSYSMIRQRTGFGNLTISRSLIFLEHLGFVSRKCGGGLFKNPSIYSLDDRWRKISASPDLLNQAIKEINLERGARKEKRDSGTGAIKDASSILANYKSCSKWTLSGGQNTPKITSETNVIASKTDVEQGSK